jgi:hypothetical protein
MLLGVSVTSGCSAFIASRGVADRRALYKLETRTQVRQVLGVPDETGSCPDGRLLERYSARQQVAKPRWMGSTVDYLRGFPFTDVALLPWVVYQSERSKLYYAFVYDATDRLLYRYDLTVPASEQFSQVLPSARDALWERLASGPYSSWRTAVEEYAEEMRRRAACLPYTVPPTEETAVMRLRAIGEAVDAGWVGQEEALTDLRLW